MKHYQLTSETFTGEVDFYFNDDGLLVRYDTSKAEITQTQQLFILRNLPTSIEMLKVIFSKSPNAKIQEVIKDVTFDMFWNRYDDKATSSRKKTQVAWNKLSKSDQIKAYRYIDRYFQSLPRGTRKKYATTYLNDELWNN